jgi:antitoxin component YwqK of YwqJK toxin-antitoxin module
MYRFPLLFTLLITIEATAQPIVEYYENGQTKHQGTMEAGKKSGKWEYYYPSGIKEAIEYFKDGRLNGTASNFDFEGNLITKENWFNGMLQDSSFYCFPGGIIEKKGVYKNSAYEGLWLFYYKDGTLRKSLEYQNGLPDGEWRYYNESGTLLQDGQYKNGLEEGEWLFYSKKGWLLYQGSYKAGKRYGEWYIYNKRGKKKLIDYSNWDF